MFQTPKFRLSQFFVFMSLFLKIYQWLRSNELTFIKPRSFACDIFVILWAHSKTFIHGFFFDNKLEGARILFEASYESKTFANF